MSERAVLPESIDISSQAQAAGRPALITKSKIDQVRDECAALCDAIASSTGKTEDVGRARAKFTEAIFWLRVANSDAA